MASRRLELRAGTVRIDITPPVGYRLVGHESRVTPSQGVHDPLSAKVLALSNGQARLAVVSAELLYFTPEIVRALRRRIARLTRIRREHLLLCTTHTHTGPGLNPDRGSFDCDQGCHAYAELLQDQICGAIMEAIAREQPVRALWGEGEVDIGIANRRDGRGGPPGQRHPVDTRVHVLKLAGRRGEPVALVFNYCCHPTTLGTDVYQVSADYPGVAQREIERRFPQACAVFVNGSDGDVRPGIMKGRRFVGGTFDDVERMGRLLAEEVIKASDAARPLKGKTLSGKLGRHPLPLDRDRIPRSVKHVGELRTHYLRTYPWLGESPEIVKRWAAHWRGVLRQGGRRPVSLPVDVQALRIGEAILVCLPGEPMVEVGIELKDRLPGPKMVIGYLGGRVGPVPSPRDVRENVPETHYFLHYLYPAPFAAGAQASLVRAALSVAQATEG